jgi:SOS-response transcriptional repressor LexA
MVMIYTETVFHVQAQKTIPVFDRAAIHRYAIHMNRIRDLRAERGLTQSQLAELAKTSQPQIRRLELGERELTKAWAERLAPHLGTTAQNLLFSESPSAELRIDLPLKERVKNVPVRGETAAGRWLEYDFATDIGEEVPVVPGKYAAAEQFAYRVVGPSMDQKRIFDGDFVICVDYWIARATPTEGDIVVVERRQGQLVERTCKQIQGGHPGLMLVSHSSDERFKEPIILPVNDDHAGENGTTIEIMGLVIGRYTKM